MKKILCFVLSAILAFNSTILVYADTSGTIPTPYPTIAPPASELILETIAKIMHPEFSALEDFIKGDSVKEELEKDGAVTSDGNYVYINSSAVDNINTKVVCCKIKM